MQDPIHPIATIERLPDGTLPARTLQGYSIGYMDRQSNVICAGCANGSDNADELPDFKPYSWFIVEEGTLWCDQSGQSGCLGTINEDEDNQE